MAPAERIQSGKVSQAILAIRYEVASCALQERLRQDEEEELRERRNLPVSEGGMIPTAQPVNAVFYKDEEAVTYPPGDYQY